jgi:hypothetical protein
MMGGREEKAIIFFLDQEVGQDGNQLGRKEEE